MGAFFFFAPATELEEHLTVISFVGPGAPLDSGQQIQILDG